ncbi:MAG: P-loop NTPase [Desulfobacterales bacterium]|nr:P-loop NTPase [Desulfobacterales bacterium]MCP4160400.1 P-loop NTPase [Deltaproteobacteria bacterium]
MIISVASGKGGTGKTTVSTNLAYSVQDATILDCDVEAPNAHLFLKPVIKDVVKAHVTIPKVDEKICNLCKKCMDICQFSAIAVIGKSLLVFPELCHSCMGCFEVCPEDALIKDKRLIGSVESGKSEDLNFIKGILKTGESMSPPLIKRVREHQRKKVNIIDAPPGTSCPVIASMTGADFVLMVTEPTPFGMHDLKLAVEAVKLLNIPYGIVINRSGKGDNEVNKYAEKENIPVLMEIPFDRKIAELYSNGEILAKEPVWKRKFKDLFNKISKLAEKEAAI